MTLLTKSFFLIIIGSVVVSNGLGVIIGYFSAPRSSGLSDAQKERLNYYDTLIKEDDSSLLNEIIKETNADFIKDNLRLGIRLLLTYIILKVLNEKCIKEKNVNFFIKKSSYSAIPKQ